jgi:hypothetical protein
LQEFLEADEVVVAVGIYYADQLDLLLGDISDGLD